MDRGDIYVVDLAPTTGSEQMGKRPVMVVSKSEFNRMGRAVICPITQGGNQSRIGGWTVPLVTAGMTTQGVVLCNQPRTIDMAARRGRKIETAPDFVVEEVLGKLQAILE